MEAANYSEKKVLLVDDEKDITDLIEEILIKEGFKNISKAYCGHDGIEICRKTNPDIIILDIMLPDVDGIEVCRTIRQFSYCPILFLSAKNSDIDKIVGLSIGADDYITKPFSPREIAFRIKAQFRRQQYEGMHYEEMNNKDSSSENLQNRDMQIINTHHRNIQGKAINISGGDNKQSRDDINKPLKFGRVLIDKYNSQVYKDDEEVKLTAKEYNILLYLADNPNRIVNKERLCEVVWGDDYIGYDNTISVHIRHLREKLEDNPSKPELIVTVIGLGYKLVKKK